MRKCWREYGEVVKPYTCNRGRPVTLQDQTNSISGRNGLVLFDELHIVCSEATVWGFYIGLGWSRKESCMAAKKRNQRLRDDRDLHLTA